MSLNSFWFVIIAVLWIGYFVLEGFDFGVGMLLKVVAKDQAERRAVITTLGPLWDGNEVWLLVAGGATFAAFPEWYATLFSGFYLPLFLILVSLIVRGVAFEYRSKYGKPEWRSRWDNAIVRPAERAQRLYAVRLQSLQHPLALLRARGQTQQPDIGTKRRERNTRTLTTLDPGVPGFMQGIIGETGQFGPAHRYPAALGLLHDGRQGPAILGSRRGRRLDRSRHRDGRNGLTAGGRADGTTRQHSYNRHTT